MQLEDALSAVEKHLDGVSAALLAADPQALELGSAQLRNASAQLSQVMAQIQRQGALPAAMQKRLQAVGAMLAVQRESLARLAAITDRQVAGLLPPADAAATYGRAMGGRNAGSVARIYRSAS
ncbi:MULTISPECIES: hypothetical protein [unclassified Acidovorax]|uniref:hypothetical protein n=1 Tax=unclassified Acidovorax TaxID=2684926 RepID=UPI000B3F99AC|nr:MULTISPECIES: hypothetical protein [unclassified Acidovorax]RDD91874.1 hypothetical protein DTW89_15630 [Acidovorax sp. BoFeN1]